MLRPSCETSAPYPSRRWFWFTSEYITARVRRFPARCGRRGFHRWCEINALDLSRLWDWRRDLTDTGRFFLAEVLPAFERRTDQCRPKPLDDFTLVGHSFDGLVVKLILFESRNSM